MSDATAPLPVVEKRCAVPGCGKPLIRAPYSNEGGLSYRLVCPLHGTRGAQ